MLLNTKPHTLNLFNVALQDLKRAMENEKISSFDDIQDFINAGGRNQKQNAVKGFAGENDT